MSTIEIDVRADLAAGREPFGRIMAAVEALPPDGVLVLRAPFEPRPLYDVLARRGFAHRTEQIAPDHFAVRFSRESSEAAGAAATIVLDVRGLPPPEPMERTLEALERLPEGAILVQINERVPRFLLPRLVERGFAHEIVERPDGEVRVLIRRAGTRPAP